MKKSVGIIGANGYTGSELVRLLAFHPNTELKFLFSRSNSGVKISELYPDLDSICDLVLTNEISETDILFLCLPHKESQNWLNENPVSEETLVIDLGNDFRLGGNFGNRNFVYGLPEIYFNEIQNSKSIANPGCFATAIQLALLPLAKENLLKDIYTTGITGSTGAGQSLQPTTHFTWRNDNISAYKTLNHQHVDEILKQVNLLNDKEVELNFVPWRGDFARGIFTSSIIECHLDLEKIYTLYKDFYKDSLVVKVSEKPIDMKQVVNTNFCVIQIEKQGNKIAVHSAIDNLLKGASGQAVQNMNIANGWEQNLGLNLKSIAF
ncbi:N-acetyl-gamma-glutamyl-phosphate reductase [Epilithonimonas ginsengisoli]|uniref:N-acetyl-gamma-glutamyl-phosphate reductase n=1 Tax=Epilithonimonas ginsengisoli TaxID=1245592 RepID=A0ABU4JLF5_9FLAO|nr:MULTISPECIES: N-acetyl-gamma-glutamyl-phosphate reductase [Chryseobacterium group]MBV6881400.1 N-acetyl-gamma-glutamyl-phosphate reductase [Epilithonimonas sp. FP105]MDW8550368.1 N-acetyl-gamma-glutamyl-phosphate reductase [Epilithonimonas ginsengisoli]OAH74205.1 N-acetyl-gamma-glutamyl-phosphate reductase [Chryseobacterium sp. FP211-J200]